jgi:hypothetical protein
MLNGFSHHIREKKKKKKKKKKKEFVKSNLTMKLLISVSLKRSGILIPTNTGVSFWFFLF